MSTNPFAKGGALDKSKGKVGGPGAILDAAATPKFGSPAWQAKFGKGKAGKSAKSDAAGDKFPDAKQDRTDPKDKKDTRFVVNKMGKKKGC